MKVFLSNFIRLFVCSFILCIQPFCLHAQTTVLTQSFKNITDETSYTAISSYNGWSFENCYAAGKVNGVDHFLQVGSGSSPYKLGSVTSPVLGVEGNVVVLVNTARVQSIAARFSVSVVGTGTVNNTEYTVASGDSYRPSAILIKGCLPSTRIVIQGTYGKFYVQTMKVFAVSDAIFYESFDYFKYENKDEFSFSNDDEAVVSSCDNYSDVGFESVKVANKKIFFDNLGHFTFQTINADAETTAMLSFRTALYPSSSHYLNITSSEGVKMASLDSKEISSLHNAYNGELTGDTKVWQNHFIILTGLNSSSSITIEGRDMFLDDVLLTPIPDGLDQSKDNTAYIEANADQVHTVTITRTLTSGIWCPLCLPFDVTPNQMATEIGTTCEIRTLSSIETSTGVFRFNSVEGTTTIDAGTPFLVKLTATVANPTFSSVAIKNTDPMSYSNGDYQFVGIYSPTYLETDGTNLFLGIDGNLYKPGTGEGENRLGGMRAYFVVPEKASARVAIFDDPATDGVNNVLRKMTKPVVYDLQGRRIDSSKANHGLYVRGGRKWIVK